MKKVFIFFLINLLAFAGLLMAEESKVDLTKKFAQSYAQVAYLNYQDASDTAAGMQVKIEALLGAPSDAALTAAKSAWLDTRVPYGQSEVFRFAEGPIDGKDDNGKEGPEGLINAWPLNEAYIDYVKDNPKAGIIQDASVDINPDVLVKKNQADDEADVTTGYHAVEFLLWGQDFNANGPGERPVSDYAKSDVIKERRRRYLHETVELLVKNLSGLAEAWAPDANNYRKTFLSLDGNEVLTRVLTSLATLSGFELASERIATALDSGDQEDEHSCFSDNTHVDFIMNAKGIETVYYGRYGAYQAVVLISLYGWLTTLWQIRLMRN